MYKKIELLTNEKHQDLRYNPVSGFEFARNVSYAPISVSEFVLSSKYYPILFSKIQPQAMVLLSVENGKNNCLNDADSTWKFPYIPAHFRKYPFIFADNTAKETEPDKRSFVLCIDRDAPHFDRPHGELMFTANGEPTQLILNTMDFLKKYHESLAATESFIKALEEMELLVDRHISIEKGGKKTLIEGFRIVDAEKINALNDSVIADWVRKGFMMLIFSHLSSLSNL